MTKPFINSVGYKWEKVLSTHKQDFAVYENDCFYTYKNLDDRSWNVAEEIQKMTDSLRIGVIIESSYDYVCAVLGILKAGKSFVPIDPGWPSERIENIIRNAEIEVVITTDLNNCKYTALNIDKIKNNESSLNQKHEWKEVNEAYVLHSSGTTGSPKGIIIGRESLVNLCVWFEKVFLREDVNNILQLAKTTFDVSVEEIFGTILNGRTLFIPPNIVRTHKIKLRQFIEEKEIHLVEVVPITLREFFAQDERIPCLKTIICGADVLQEKLKDSIIELGYELYNNYGPTEATVDSMYYKCNLSEPVQLGECIDGCEYAILTEEGELVTNNNEGELLLAGKNLAIGYLKNEELNEQKFMCFPSGKRYYRTGDLVKIDEQNRVFFKGRIDNQVKIRGQRIEIEEIEKAFAEKMNISVCAVICTKEKGEKIILFYESDKEIDYKHIIDCMKGKLPDYMLPSDYRWAEYLPRTENGKVDRNALIEHIKNIPKENHESNIQAFDEVTVNLIKKMAEVIGTDENSIDITDLIEYAGFDSLSYVRFLVEVECMWDLELGEDLLVPDDNETVEMLLKKIKEAIAEV